MEFKGTKGKWHIEDKQASIFDDNGKSIICWHGVAISTFEADEIQLKSNSLLISKAPEMLEMLSSLISVFKRGEFDNKGNIGSDLLNKAQQLIKQATEING